MKAKPKEVFDTNIYISAVIFGGNPRQCLELARSGQIELFISKAILLELARKLKEKFLWQEQDIVEVIKGLAVFAKVIIPRKKIRLVKAEPKDNSILECAIEAKADYIVSGDKKHLLSLKKFKNIPVISSKQFLDRLYSN